MIEENHDKFFSETSKPLNLDKAEKPVDESVIGDLAEQWLHHATQEKEHQTAKRALAVKLRKAAKLPEDAVQTASFDVGVGRVIIRSKTSQLIDKDLLVDLGQNHPEVVSRGISFTPKINRKGFNGLTAEQQRLIESVCEVRAAAPQVEVKGADNE